ncbi:hypothetical protein A3Q56_00582 [Intoshia linei]|uniref:Major facilitator superfamily (MFS) profile domain-containing protein n=1 Tax=Intoshia linei TaxID=1819745 RepID=A0A177BBA0_9BILA|nr:hypothetical protein A3Q56_00582 [Intoshia linei]
MVTRIHHRIRKILVVPTYFLQYTTMCCYLESLSQIIINIKSQFNYTENVIGFICAASFSLPLVCSSLVQYVEDNTVLDCAKIVFIGGVLAAISSFHLAIVINQYCFILFIAFIFPFSFSMIITSPIYVIDKYFPKNDKWHAFVTSIGALGYPFAHYGTLFGVQLTSECSECAVTDTQKSGRINSYREDGKFKIRNLSSAYGGYLNSECSSSVQKNIPEKLISKSLYLQILLFFASFFKAIGYYTPIVYIIRYMLSKNIHLVDAVQVVTIYGVSEATSRLLTSAIGRFLEGKFLIIYGGCALSLFLISIGGGFSNQLFEMYLYVIGQGLFGGPIIAGMYVSCEEIMNTRKIKHLFVIYRFGMGIGLAIGPQIAAQIIRTTGRYFDMFIMVGVSYAFASIIYILLHVFRIKEKDLEDVTE